MIFPFLMGAGAAFLWIKHKGRGIDYCNNCKQSGQIGEFIRYLPTESKVEIPLCKKCKPEIFPRTNISLIGGFLKKKVEDIKPIKFNELIPGIFDSLKNKNKAVKVECGGETKYANNETWTDVADELVSKHGEQPKVSFVDTDDHKVEQGNQNEQQ